MDRRTQVDDKQAELEIHLQHMWPERWQQLYGTPAGDYGSAFDGEQEIPITDPDDLDRWFQGLDGARSMSSGEFTELLGWSDGEGGIRV